MKRSSATGTAEDRAIVGLDLFGGRVTLTSAGILASANSFVRNIFYVHSYGWQSVLMLSQEKIQNALKAVHYPGYSRDIVSFGMVKEISTTDGKVSVVLQLPSTSQSSGAGR